MGNLKPNFKPILKPKLKHLNLAPGPKGFYSGNRRITTCLPLRYIDDLVTKEEAVEMLETAAEGKEEREERLMAEGYPAYTTQAGSFA